MGGSPSASSEPGQTILRVAGRIEGLPQRFGAHPSAYAVSFQGPGALSWLPAHWVSADALALLAASASSSTYPRRSHGTLGQLKLLCMRKVFGCRVPSRGQMLF